MSAQCFNWKFNIFVGPYLTFHWDWSLQLPSILPLDVGPRATQLHPLLAGWVSRQGHIVLWCSEAKHCTCSPNNRTHYNLTGKRSQKMPCKGGRPCRSLPPKRDCLADQGSPRKLDKSYDFFIHSFIFWVKCMDQDAFHASHIGERMKMKTGKLREKALARFNIHLMEEELYLSWRLPEKKVLKFWRQRERNCTVLFSAPHPTLAPGTVAPASSIVKALLAASGPASHVVLQHFFLSHKWKE